MWPWWHQGYRFLVTVVLPFSFMLVLAFVYWILSKIWQRFMSKDVAPNLENHIGIALAVERLKNIKRISVLVLTVSYVTIIKYGLSLYKCQRGFLREDPLYECDTSTYLTFGVLSGVMLALVGVTLPVIILIVLCKCTKCKTDCCPRMAVARNLLVFLGEPYNNDVSYFDAIIMVRKLAHLVLFTFVSNFAAQVATSMCISLMYLILVCIKQPYRFAGLRSPLLRRFQLDAANGAEMLSALVTSLLFLLALIVARGADANQLAIVILVIVFKTLFVICILVIAYIRLGHVMTEAHGPEAMARTAVIMPANIFQVRPAAHIVGSNYDRYRS